MAQLFIGGRLHGEEIILLTDEKGMPPATYTDILTATTYRRFPVTSIIPEQGPLGEMQTAYSRHVYIHESARDGAVVQEALKDAALRLWFKQGEVVEVHEVPAQTENGGSNA